MSDFRHPWRAALTSETSPATATQRLVGLIVAEYANRDSGVAYPAAKTIGRRAQVDERTVRRSLDELVGLGFLLAEKARGKVTRYLLTVPELRAHDPHLLRAQRPHSESGVRTLTTISAGTVSASAGTAPDEPRKRKGYEPGAASAGAPPTAAPPAKPHGLHCPFCDYVCGADLDWRTAIDDETLTTARIEHIRREHPPRGKLTSNSGMTFQRLEAGVGESCWTCEALDTPRWQLVHPHAPQADETLCGVCLTLAGWVAIDGLMWLDVAAEWREPIP